MSTPEDYASLLDARHGTPSSVARRDNNDYTLGRIGEHNVVTPRDGMGGTTGFLNQPPMVLRTAMAGLRSTYESEGLQFEATIRDALDKKPRLQKKYSRPDQTGDRLYQSNIVHPINSEGSCKIVCGDDKRKLVSRRDREEDEDNPAIHYGLIASANQLMKDAVMRDTLAAEMGVSCFEMEAAGLMNQVPCLVIRGICDYSDSHKNKEWQGYAAITAAAYAKGLLCRIPPNKVKAEQKIKDALSHGQLSIHCLDYVAALFYV
ncbi:purine and uridine phosphorylase [Trichoderma novae-zelandiae]